MLKPVSNPPNPWHTRSVEWLGEPPGAELNVYEERAKTILNDNDSPDVGFRWGINPYRGCQHACAYCYARPSHQYLDFGAGTDFERKIVVKVNAPELLDREFGKKSWLHESILISGNTDCYQPLEANYRLTRRCLEVCVAHRNPAALITKGPLICRDLDVLRRLHEVAGVAVFVTIPFLDSEVARKLEPGAAAPERRFEIIRALSEAGIPCGVSLAPLIPGLNESDMAGILEKSREAGARRAFFTMLRLAREVLPVFTERITAEFPPERVKKIFNGIREMRQGRLNDGNFGTRMEGSGPRWDLVSSLFDSTCRRLGLNAEEVPEVTRIPVAPAQGSLF